MSYASVPYGLRPPTTALAFSFLTRREQTKRRVRTCLVSSYIVIRKKRVSHCNSYIIIVYINIQYMCGIQARRAPRKAIIIWPAATRTPFFQYI